MSLFNNINDIFLNGNSTSRVVLNGNEVWPLTPTNTPTPTVTSTPTPLDSTQLLVNPHFDLGTTGWSATGGFGTWSFSSSNQVAVLNSVLYFTYVSRTVSQSVNVSSYISSSDSFEGVLNIKREENGPNNNDTYTFTLLFKNSSGATVATKTTGSSIAPLNYTDITLTLNRSEIPSTFDTIVTVDVQITGIDAGFWNGNHGPWVDYVNLMIVGSPSSTPTPTITETLTPTPTLTITPTITETLTPTPTLTITPTVSSNLVLYFDPSNPSSYPGSGTTITDLSGNGLNGTMSNITYTSPAFSFNGTNSTISITDNGLLEPESGDWTMEAWVNHSVIAGLSRVIFAKTDGGNSADWGYGLRTTSVGTTFAEVGNGTTSLQSNTSTLTTGVWYQVVAVWTNIVSNSFELFINGVSQGSKSHSFTSIKNTTSPLYIGSFNNGQFSQWLNGQIGVVRIYNKSLTSSEVLQNFNSDKSKYGL